MIALAMVKVHVGNELVPLCVYRFNKFRVTAAVDVTFVILFFGISFWVNRRKCKAVFDKEFTNLKCMSLK